MAYNYFNQNYNKALADRYENAGRQIVAEFLKSQGYHEAVENDDLCTTRYHFTTDTFAPHDMTVTGTTESAICACEIKNRLKKYDSWGVEKKKVQELEKFRNKYEREPKFIYIYRNELYVAPLSVVKEQGTEGIMHCKHYSTASGGDAVDKEVYYLPLNQWEMINLCDKIPSYFNLYNSVMSFHEKLNDN